jgi:protein SCO1
MLTRRDFLTGLRTAKPMPPMANAQAVPKMKPAPRKMYDRSYFGNAVLTTQEGKQVRFYDDLVRGKLVTVNMFFAQCESVCPLMTANLAKVQKMLGDRVGRDIFMYSITLLPEQDNPQRLQEYAEMHGIAPGWQFLTGSRADITELRRRLGFYDPDPDVDSDVETHTGLVRIGDDVHDRWMGAPALADPKVIFNAIAAMDRSLKHVARTAQ